jgi:hypothetical protein
MCKTGLELWARGQRAWRLLVQCDVLSQPRKSESQSSQSRREDTEILFVGFSVFSQFLRVLCGVLFFG